MAYREKEWTVDWRKFNWKAVDKELEDRNKSSEEELSSITRDMFVEYIQWMHDTSLELLDIMVRMYWLQEQGAPKEEVDRWKDMWNGLTGNKQ